MDSLTAPTIFEASLDDHIVVQCPDCLDPMLLGKWWRELILGDGHEIPYCPECNESADSWADDAEPKMDGAEFDVIAGDVIETRDPDDTSIEEGSD
jgi:hypothetical protein